jgi:murein DD-endopeptidase MepM/ murein hydrolase activator NlpD
MPASKIRVLLALLMVLMLAIPAIAIAAEPVAASEPAPAPEATAPAVPSETTPTTTVEAPPPVEEAPAQVQSQAPQGASEGAKVNKPAESKKAGGEEEGEETDEEGPRSKHRAVSPSTLTPTLPFALQNGFGGLSGFFIESFQIPPFLLPIFQAAGTAYGVPWQVLAAINEVETDYGRDLSVSSAGAEGWMQFLPATWAQYGVDANGDGFKDPYNPADAIFAAARYLRAAGAEKSVKAAVFSYNHSATYVASVMLRAQLLGATPSELLGAITGLTEARFPVHAAAHFTDGFPTVKDGTSTRTIAGTTIYAAAGAPVIAVQDGEIIVTGDSPSLGHFISLRDAFGNTYTYADLGDVSVKYPVIEPRVDSKVNARLSGDAADAEPAPSGPASAGVQDRSPISEAGTVSSLALGAAAQLESVPAPSTPTPTTPVAAPVTSTPSSVAPGVSEFS